MSTCRSCDAPIEWVLTERDKPMPLDVAPAENGNIVKVSRRATERGMTSIVKYLRKGEEHNGPRFTSHFATCPDAEDHRRG